MVETEPKNKKQERKIQLREGRTEREKAEMPFFRSVGSLCRVTNWVRFQRKCDEDGAGEGKLNPAESGGAGRELGIMEKGGNNLKSVPFFPNTGLSSEKCLGKGSNSLLSPALPSCHPSLPVGFFLCKQTSWRCC